MVAVIPVHPGAKTSVNLRYSSSKTLTGNVGIKSRIAGTRRRFMRLEDGLLSIYHVNDEYSEPLTSVRVPEAVAIVPDPRKLLVKIQVNSKQTLTLSFKNKPKMYDVWIPALEQAVLLNIHKHYKLYREIGKGHYARVHEAVDRKTGEKVAVKVISKQVKDEKTKQYIRREAEIVRIVEHPNIVRTLDVFETETHLYIVMEYASEGNLLHFFRSEKSRINEKNARRLAHQLLSAIKYLHSKSIIHRDIKPENILINRNGDLKLADFGLARVLDGVCSDEYCLSSILGTPSYCSPEVASKTQYGKPVDLYGCGVLIYVALSGALPFKGRNPTEVFEAIKRGDVQFPAVRWAMITDEAKDFVFKLLNREAKDRPTAASALNHPWLNCSMDRAPSSPKLMRNFSAQSTASGTGQIPRYRALAAVASTRSFRRAPTGSLKDLEESRNHRARSL